MLEKEIHLTESGSELKVVIKKSAASNMIHIRQVRIEGNSLLTCMHLTPLEAKELANALNNLIDDPAGIVTQVSVIK